MAPPKVLWLLRRSTWGGALHQTGPHMIVTQESDTSLWPQYGIKIIKLIYNMLNRFKGTVNNLHFHLWNYRGEDSPSVMINKLRQWIRLIVPSSCREQWFLILLRFSLLYFTDPIWWHFWQSCFCQLGRPEPRCRFFAWTLFHTKVSWLTT